MSYLSEYFRAGWLNVWDLGLAIHDLNYSQDPKHTLFCRENVFFATKQCTFGVLAIIEILHYRGLRITLSHPTWHLQIQNKYNILRSICQYVA